MTHAVQSRPPCILTLRVEVHEFLASSTTAVGVLAETVGVAARGAGAVLSTAILAKSPFV